MTIAFFSNFINHHQYFVAKELYELTGGQYVFVELVQMPQAMVDAGYPVYADCPFVLRAWQNDANAKQAVNIAQDYDVCLFGGHEALPYEVKRAKLGRLSFDVGERYLKRGILNMLSPRLLKAQWYYHTLFRYKPVYKLCCSAYTAVDMHKLCSFNDRTYKWGYFTEVDETFDFVNACENNDGRISIMWCARFLKWKHPELAVALAAKLKESGCNFVIDMFGSGVELERIKRLVEELHVSDVVRFMGNMPNKDIIAQMRRHDIFLFTSDKNEGWGAVANEAMSNGSVIVASDAIGSVPFLVTDGVNGCVFESCNLTSIYEKVKFLIDNPSLKRQMAINAYRQMKNVWSPRNAAKNLLQLIDDLNSGKDTSTKEGPCSKAPAFI